MASIEDEAAFAAVESVVAAGLLENSDEEGEWARLTEDALQAAQLRPRTPLMLLAILRLRLPRRTIPEADRGAECIVCRSGLEVASETCGLPCGHCQWHEECIFQWLAEQPTCPICRRRVSVQLADSSGDPNIDFEATTTITVADSVDDDAASVSTVDIWGSAVGVGAQSNIAPVQRIEGELAGFREQLDRLSNAHAGLCDEIGRLHTQPGQGRAQAQPDASPTLAGQRAGGFGNQGFPGRFPRLLAPLPETQPVDSGVADQTDAEAMLARLQGSMIRSPTAAAEVHRILASRVGRLGPREVNRVLQGLDTAVPRGVLERCFAAFDGANVGLQMDPQGPYPRQLTDRKSVV